MISFPSMAGALRGRVKSLTHGTASELEVLPDEA